MANVNYQSFWLALENTPFQVTWADIDGVRTRIIEAGATDGPVILMIHGTGGHAEAFIYNISELARTYRVIAYDLPAHGWSANPRRSYEIQGFVDHLVAMIEWTGSEQVVLCGQSLGGWIAVQYVATHSHSINALILIGPGGVHTNSDVMAQVRALSRTANITPDTENVRARLQLIIGNESRLSSELIQCRLLAYEWDTSARRSENMVALQDPVIRSRNLLSEETLRLVDVPTLVVSGSADTIVPPTVAKRVSDFVPSAEFVVLKGSGHWPQFEDPRAFNAVALDFLNNAAWPV